MKKITSSFFTWLFFLFCFASTVSGEFSENKEFVGTETLKVASKNSEFCFDFYQNSDEKKGNFSFSPYSLSSCLAMVYNGAEEETQKEMAFVLKFETSLEKLNLSFSLLNAYFNKKEIEKTQEFEMNVQNSLWFQAGIFLLPEFLDSMGKYFKVSVRHVDFLRLKEFAREQINEYVKEKTHGKIIDLVKRDDLSTSTKMVLISSFYLKANWKKPFDKNLTKKEPFYIVSKEGEAKEVSAELMQDKGFYPYLKLKNFSALELPLLQVKPDFPDVRFLVLLPDKVEGLEELKSQLNEALFEKIISEMESRYVTLFLPKFNFTKAVSLKNILMKMGMQIPFTQQANFRGISGSKDLYLSQVAHQVYISIDEKGVELAAGTAAFMNMKSFLPGEKEVIFKANHPFIFIIYEKLTHSILVLGHVINPLERF